MVLSSFLSQMFRDDVFENDALDIRVKVKLSMSSVWIARNHVFWRQTDLAINPGSQRYVVRAFMQSLLSFSLCMGFEGYPLGRVTAPAGNII